MILFSDNRSNWNNGPDWNTKEPSQTSADAAKGKLYDSNQNTAGAEHGHTFWIHYISEANFDRAKCLILFGWNDTPNVNKNIYLLTDITGYDIDNVI